MPRSKADSALLRGAEARAAILAFMEQPQPGAQSPRVIAEALGIHPATAGQHLNHLAMEGLIAVQKVGTKKFFSPKSAKSAPVVAAKQQGKTRATSAAKEIELVVNNTLIIIARNPATNRLRIVLEDQ